MDLHIVLQNEGVEATVEAVCTTHTLALREAKRVMEKDTREFKTRWRFNKNDLHTPYTCGQNESIEIIIRPLVVE